MSAKSSVFQFQSPDDSPGFLLWQVSNLWQRKLNAGLRQMNLTHVQFVLLAVSEWLGYNHDLVTQVQLAAQAKTDIMMTSNVLKSLEKKGLVSRTPHPTDTRAKCVALTGEGHKVLLKAIKFVDRIDNEFFAALGDSVSDFNSLLIALKAQHG